ncbi:hypothetical protein M404DRAFT_991920 [Pisolithus tinctorius Marx 270]|uniref:Secreted protein n=1 Tax=Pisolithus tinctorius Marx 270 TaxID=870435 RepID=A0A0C3K1A8_PISTI|nr:hypothetical protein M404DRAFT_991920 [Pisolithus tinctorius Marx 270]
MCLWLWSIESSMLWICIYADGPYQHDGICIWPQQVVAYERLSSGTLTTLKGALRYLFPLSSCTRPLGISLSSPYLAGYVQPSCSHRR